MPTRERRLQHTEQQRKRNEEQRKRRAFRERSKNRKPGQAHTIPSFCENNMISESKYYDLKRRGRGPREVEVDARIIITEEAEADWRREREAETAAKRRECEQATAAELPGCIQETAPHST
jgi:hypothetical protein